MSAPQTKANGKGKKRAAKRKEVKEESSESEMSVSEAEDQELKENGSSSDEEMDITNPSNVYNFKRNFRLKDSLKFLLESFINLFLSVLIM